MKQYFYFSRLVLLLSFFVLNFFRHNNSFSQTSQADTNHIITLMDSCYAVDCGNSLLKLIQTKLPDAQNKKEKIFYQKAEIKALRIIGNAYKNSLFNLPKAMEYYQLSRKKAEEIDNKLGIAASLLNIGIIYTDLSDYPKALEYQEKSLKIFREIYDEKGIGICLNNLGSIYKNQSNYSKALEYFQSSLAIQEARKDTFEILTCFHNIGVVYEQLKDFPKAIEYYQMELKYANQINDDDGVIGSLVGIGNILSSTGKQKEAEQYYVKALKLATNSIKLSMQSEVANALRNIFEKQGRYKEALEMSDKHILLRDSIFSQNKSKEIALRDAKYDSDKKEATMQAVAEEEKQKSKVIILSVLSGLLLVIVFAGFIFRSLRVTRKQKSIIEVQKKLVEAHQKEIIDSITYAKRLQEAILPPLDFVKKHLPDSFVLYKPKDIIAGDFFWMEVMDDIIFIASADCTGHGVAGCMLSICCSNALNRTVKEFGLRDTGKILDKVTELVLETFERSNEDVKDGMDISLLAISKTTKQIQWSGANNSLWYIHNGEIKEIAPNKQPIGKHDNRKPFTTNDIIYQPYTTFYLFTDGFCDQFGGAKGKKFKYKQLEEKLLGMSEKPLTEQKDLLDKIFVDWMGKLEQVDDVNIIGIRI